MNKVRELRRAKGMTQTELAKITGLTRQTICKVESNRAKNLRWWTMKVIADALGGSIPDIFLL